MTISINAGGMTKTIPGWSEHTGVKTTTTTMSARYKRMVEDPTCLNPEQVVGLSPMPNVSRKGKRACPLYFKGRDRKPRMSPEEKAAEKRSFAMSAKLSRRKLCEGVMPVKEKLMNSCLERLFGA